MTNLVYIDFETASEAALKKVGAWLYARHPSTHTQCLVFGIDANNLHLVKNEDHALERYEGQFLFEFADDSNCIFVAHNAYFDQQIWQAIMVEKYGYPEVPTSRWKCTMAKSLAYGLPGSLEEAAITLNLDFQKDMHGKKVMETLCKPRRKSKKNDETFWTPESAPAAFETLYHYCKRDVETMIELDSVVPDLSKREQRVWQIDQRINHDGVRLDEMAIHAAQKLRARNKSQLMFDFGDAVHDNLGSPTQRELFKKWLKTQGVIAKDTKAPTFKTILKGKVSADVRRAITIAQELGKTSLSKLDAMISRSDDSFQLRELFQYHGTHTGRWAGRGVQLQNLKRSSMNMDMLIAEIKSGNFDKFEFLFGDVNDALSQSIRGMIIPDEGKKLYIADFAQMEARVLPWLAGDDVLLRMFREGVDLYLVDATQIYGREITKEDKDERFTGKLSRLSLGYGGGIAAYGKMSVGYDVDLMPTYKALWPTATAKEREKADKAYLLYTKKFQDNQKRGLQKGEEPLTKEEAFAADIIKQRWRIANPKIVQFWSDLEYAFMEALEEPYPVVTVGCISVFANGLHLHCKLPSGRLQTYPLAGADDKGKLVYQGKDPKTGKPVRVHLYGGKIAENITQAVQRDLLSDAMIRIEDKLQTYFHVHDEIVCQSDWDGAAEYLEEQMKKSRPWAAGIPIDAVVDEVVRYRK